VNLGQPWSFNSVLFLQIFQDGSLAGVGHCKKKQVVKVIRKKLRPRCCRTRAVQSHSPGCANVHLDLTHASFDQPESTSQTASRSVQPFLHSSRHRESLYFTMGRPSPSKGVSSHGGSGPHLAWFPGPTRVHNLNDISIGWRFLHG